MGAPACHDKRVHHLKPTKLLLAAMITAMDFGIAKTVAKLSQLNIMDDTIIIFSSDASPFKICIIGRGPYQKGPFLYTYIHNTLFSSQNGPTQGSAFPLRGTKRSIWEGGHKVGYRSEFHVTPSFSGISYKRFLPSSTPPISYRGAEPGAGKTNKLLIWWEIEMSVFTQERDKHALQALILPEGASINYTRLPRVLCQSHIVIATYRKYLCVVQWFSRHNNHFPDVSQTLPCDGLAAHHLWSYWKAVVGGGKGSTIWSDAISVDNSHHSPKRYLQSVGSRWRQSVGGDKIERGSQEDGDALQHQPEGVRVQSGERSNQVQTRIYSLYSIEE